MRMCIVQYWLVILSDVLPLIGIIRVMVLLDVSGNNPDWFEHVESFCQG